MRILQLCILCLVAAFGSVAHATPKEDGINIKRLEMALEAGKPDPMFDGVQTVKPGTTLAQLKALGRKLDEAYKTNEQVYPLLSAAAKATSHVKTIEQGFDAMKKYTAALADAVKKMKE